MHVCVKEKMNFFVKATQKTGKSIVVKLDVMIPHRIKVLYNTLVTYKEIIQWPSIGLCQ